MNRRLAPMLATSAAGAGALWLYASPQVGEYVDSPLFGVATLLLLGGLCWWIGLVLDVALDRIRPRKPRFEPGYEPIPDDDLMDLADEVVRSERRAS